MEPERWQQIDRVLAAALETQEGQRSAFLDTACGDDQSLRQEVESLLTAHEEAENLMEDPAVEMVAAGFAEDPGPSLIGKQMGSYEIVSHLGSGGMGEVY